MFQTWSKQATTSHKGEKVISYAISFKLEVVVVAEKKKFQLLL